MISNFFLRKFYGFGGRSILFQNLHVGCRKSLFKLFMAFEGFNINIELSQLISSSASPLMLFQS